MPPISAGERPQTYALDRAANGNGTQGSHLVENKIKKKHYFPEFVKCIICDKIKVNKIILSKELLLFCK
jgi:hypothetical protein